MTNRVDQGPDHLERKSPTRLRDPDQSLIAGNAKEADKIETKEMIEEMTEEVTEEMREEGMTADESSAKDIADLDHVDRTKGERETFVRRMVMIWPTMSRDRHQKREEP